MPDGGLTISADGRSATLQMSRVPIIDQPRWPAIDAAVKPAFMTFRMTWKASDQQANTDDSAKLFRLTGHKAAVQLEASVEVPSDGFSWKSDPQETSHAEFALMGDEVNGRYYSK